MNLPEIQVCLILRAKGSFRSIEEQFTSICDAFPPFLTGRLVAAPQTRANLRAIFGNLWWMIRMPGADIVHVTGDIHYAVLGAKSARTVLTIHDLRFYDEGRGIRRFLFWLGWIALPVLRANAITVISDFTKERLLSCFPFGRRKIHVIPDCVAPEFKPLPKPWDAPQPRILLVGTTPNKNLERITEACRGLAIRFSVLGRLSDEQKTGFNTNNLEYEERFDLTRVEVVSLYQSCDLVMFVSTYEGFGMPILEAQAVGRPVLTSDISPMKEVAGEGALKIDPFDVAAIREGLTRLLEDGELRDRLVEEGFRNVAKYSAESVAAQYAALYCEVLGTKVALP